MKYLFLFSFIFFFASNPINAQCNFSVNEVDEFTKKKKVETKELKFSGKVGMNSFIRFGSVGDNYHYLSLKINRESLPIVSSDDKLLIFLDNGEVLECLPVKPEVPEVSTDYGVLMSTLFIQYNLSEEQSDQIAKNQIKKVRVGSFDGYLELEPKPKLKAKIMKAANCAFN